jgi:hypothetical protein
MAIMKSLDHCDIRGEYQTQSWCIKKKKTIDYLPARYENYLGD